MSRFHNYHDDMNILIVYKRSSRNFFYICAWITGLRIYNSAIHAAPTLNKTTVVLGLPILNNSSIRYVHERIEWRHMTTRVIFKLGSKHCLKTWPERPKTARNLLKSNGLPSNKSYSANQKNKLTEMLETAVFENYVWNYICVSLGPMR